MQPVWDFLADHRYILWIGVAYGSWGLLLNTILYRRYLYYVFNVYRRNRHRLDSQLPPFMKRISQRMMRWSRKKAHNSWYWLIGCLLSLGIVLASIAGLVLLLPINNLSRRRSDGRRLARLSAFAASAR